MSDTLEQKFGVMASIGASIQDTVQSVQRLEAIGLDLDNEEAAKKLWEVSSERTGVKFNV